MKISLKIDLKLIALLEVVHDERVANVQGKGYFNPGDADEIEEVAKIIVACRELLPVFGECQAAIELKDFILRDVIKAEKAHGKKIERRLKLDERRNRRNADW